MKSVGDKRARIRKSYGHNRVMGIPRSRAVLFMRRGRKNACEGIAYNVRYSAIIVARRELKTKRLNDNERRMLTWKVIDLTTDSQNSVSSDWNQF